MRLHSAVRPNIDRRRECTLASMRQLARRTAILLVSVLSGCAYTVDQAPPPAATAVSDLRGTWAGTWGGAPVQLVVVEQRELGDYAGVYLGPVQVLGRRRPGVSGVLTSTISSRSLARPTTGGLAGASPTSRGAPRVRSSSSPGRDDRAIASRRFLDEPEIFWRHSKL